MGVNNALQVRKVFIGMIIILVLQYIFICPVVMAGRVDRIYSEKIARGITFEKNHYSDYGGQTGKKETEYIITADLNDTTVDIISGKAGDEVMQLGTISGQIAREKAIGRNVVAGINGDMFSSSAATPNYGNPIGLQVKDGKIILGFASALSAQRYPVFAIDKNRRVLITYLSLDAKLSAIDEAYESVNHEPNPALTTTIDSINRYNIGNSLVLETPQLGVGTILGFSGNQAVNAAFTVLKNISGGDRAGIELGKEYTAEVASIGDVATTGVKSMVVPANSLVLSSQGIKATWVKTHLKAGDKISFTFNLNDQNGNSLDIAEAVTGYLPLVENGRALAQKDMLAKCGNNWASDLAIINSKDKARSAIGITTDNKVIALAIDGGGVLKDSYGMDLPGMAVRMKELGAVSAISLDGGGSTQMNTRLFGESRVQVIDRPSDGKERAISNSILFISNAPKTGDIKELKVDSDITIFKNGTYSFRVRGQDSNGNPADLTKSNVIWSIQSDNESSDIELSGAINNQGVFKAGDKAAKELVCAEVGSVKGVARVNVVDSVYSLGLEECGILALQPNDQKQLHLTARTADGEPILITNDAAEWTVSPSWTARIDKNGLLTPLSTGNAVVNAQVGDKKVSINIVSGLKSQVIDSFENAAPGCYSVSGYVGGTCQTNTTQVKDGHYSLRVDYDYSRWSKASNGTINIKLNPVKKPASYTSQIRPQKIGMWVYGDGRAPWLRAVLKDGNGNQVTVNLASSINWVGWKYIEAPIPQGLTPPISLDYIYMVEINKNKNIKGTVYFDDVRFKY